MHCKPKHQIASFLLICEPNRVLYVWRTIIMQVDNNIMFENKQNIRILCVEKLLI